MNKTHRSVRPSSQDWGLLDSNQAWLGLCQVLRDARDRNRRVLETGDIDIEKIRFLQGENRAINLLIEGDLRTFVSNALEKENSKYGLHTGTDRGNRKTPR